VVLGSVFALVCVPATTAASSRSVTLRSAGGTAACRMSIAEAVCANRTVQNAARPVALVLPRNGSPRADHRALAWSSKTPVLEKGASHRLGRFTCTALGSGLLCRVPGGAAIAVSATGISVLAAPAVHHA
jgi:hypothetical protein